MEEQNVMTIPEVIAITKEILENIDLKGKEIDRIGVPISRCISNLDVVCMAINEQKEREAEADDNPENDQTEPEDDTMPPEDETQEEENADAE